MNSVRLKKAFVLLAILPAVLVFTACGKSEAAASVEAIIFSIGEVSLENENRIAVAEAAYAALSDKDRRHVENYDTLRQARSTYNSLLVAEVEAVIDEIGTVTLDNQDGSLDRITAARESYAALSDELKPDVSNLSILTEAEAEYTQLEIGVVEEAIGEIGTVALNNTSERKIEKAQAAYDAAAPEIQAKISNLEELIRAWETLDRLKVESVESAIDAIGAVSLDSGPAILAAERKYDAYPAEIQGQVKNVQILEEARARYSQLKIENAEQLILSIGDVTLESEAAIEAAETAYKALSAAEKEQIANAQILTDATTQLNQLVKEEQERQIQAALSKLTRDYDKVRDITFYESKLQPQYINSRSYIQPYISCVGTVVNLRIIIDYVSRRMLYWTSLTFLVDGSRYYRSYSYNDVERSINIGNNAEYVDISADEKDIALLEEIAASQETIVRFNEDSSHYADYTVSAADKTAIRDVLDAYYLLSEAGISLNSILNS